MFFLVTRKQKRLFEEFSAPLKIRVPINTVLDSMVMVQGNKIVERRSTVDDVQGYKRSALRNISKKSIPFSLSGQRRKSISTILHRRSNNNDNVLQPATSNDLIQQRMNNDTIKTVLPSINEHDEIDRIVGSNDGLDLVDFNTPIIEQPNNNDYVLQPSNIQNDKNDRNIGLADELELIDFNTLIVEQPNNNVDVFQQTNNDLLELIGFAGTSNEDVQSDKNIPIRPSLMGKKALPGLLKINPTKQRKFSSVIAGIIYQRAQSIDLTIEPSFKALVTLDPIIEAEPEFGKLYYSGSSDSE